MVVFAVKKNIIHGNSWQYEKALHSRSPSGTGACSLFVKINKGINCAFAEYPIYPAIIVDYKIVIKAFYF